MVAYNNANFVKSRLNFYPSISLTKKLRKVQSKYKSVFIKFIRKKYLNEPDKIEDYKAKIIKKIFYENFVTKLRNDLRPYLEKVDYTISGTPKPTDKIMVDAEKFYDMYGIPLKYGLDSSNLDFFNINLDNEDYWKAFSVKHYWDFYKKKAPECQKCRDYTCGKHSTIITNILQQKIREVHPELNKRLASKLSKALTNYVFRIEFKKEYLQLHNEI